jgi:hypothetical protein
VRVIHSSKPSDGEQKLIQWYCYNTNLIVTLDLNTEKLPSPMNDVLSRKVEADMIGTPDPVSNLRPVRYFVSVDETPEVGRVILEHIE